MISASALVAFDRRHPSKQFHSRRLTPDHESFTSPSPPTGTMHRRSMSRSPYLRTRASVALLFCSTACLIITGTLSGFEHSTASVSASQRSLTFAERVAYQRAIEDVYWHHRIWPRGSEGSAYPKPSLEAVISNEQLEKKVEDYLRKSPA